METLKILIVDDEPGIRSGITRILKYHQVSYPFMEEDFNFRILEAATGEESIDIVEKQKPDIILLDNKLPGIQGIDVLKYIREKQLDTVVAMITSYASLDLAMQATDDGASDFIPKPFTPQELKIAIDNITKHLYLRRITKKLRQEGKQVRFQFLSVLSHELKAPLNAIEGYLKMMQEKQAGSDIAAYDKQIERSLTRIKGMRNLIMDLLDFTKIGWEQKTKKLNQVNIDDMARMAINTIQPYAIQKNIQIFLHSKAPVIIKANSSDIEIVLNNLLSNAVKYNYEDGRVDIELASDNKFVIIKVEDTGMGIAPDEQQSIFHEFFRVKNEKTKEITGSGLGLSIVKKIVELYKGEISVSSTPDIGSTFTVKLPKN